MKKQLSILGIFALILSTGCSKMFDKNGFFDEVTSEEAQLRLNQSKYEIEITEPLLSSLALDYYTSGVVNYKLNGQTVASVDYGDGTHDSKAVKTINGSDEEFDLEKQCEDSKSKNYYKMIIEPIVKTNDCDYIVAGVVKYFKCETKEWYATVNYGDGTCDGVAFKEWDGGSKEFSLDWDKK
jgi:hypothetical protein